MCTLANFLVCTKQKKEDRAWPTLRFSDATKQTRSNHTKLIAKKSNSDSSLKRTPIIIEVVQSNGCIWFFPRSMLSAVGKLTAVIKIIDLASNFVLFFFALISFFLILQFSFCFSYKIYVIDDKKEEKKLEPPDATTIVTIKITLRSEKKKLFFSFFLESNSLHIHLIWRFQSSPSVFDKLLLFVHNVAYMFVSVNYHVNTWCCN